MSESTSFAELMAQLRGGQPDAAERIVALFARRLAALARRRLDALVREKLDPEDVLQSVFRSFFRRQNEGEFVLQGWEELWSLLALITLRKCGHQVAYYRAARRDIHREVTPPATEESHASWEAVAREPTPEEAVILTETVERLMVELRPRDRKILELSLQELPPPDISRQLGCSERTVHRVRERIRRRLEEMRTELEASAL